VKEQENEIMTSRIGRKNTKINHSLVSFRPVSEVGVGESIESIESIQFGREQTLRSVD